MPPILRRTSLSLSSAPPNGRSWRRKLGPLDGPLLVCAGRLLPIKGFEDAIRATGLLRERLPRIRLVIAGPDRDGHERRLRQLAADTGVAKAVTVTGPVSAADLRRLLASADVVVVPSILEGMNKVAVEAAAVGTPCVITRTTGIAATLASAGAGRLVEPRDPEGLARETALLLEDETLRVRVGQAGPALAAGFRSAAIARALEDLCREGLSAC